jgi:hypothetical protein
MSAAASYLFYLSCLRWIDVVSRVYFAANPDDEAPQNLPGEIELNRADEDRILHGLYYHRQAIDADVDVTGEQILWLAMHPLEEGEAWERDGQLQSLDIEQFPPEIRPKLIAAKLELPLRYLQYRRLIKYVKHRDATHTLAVTFAGADRAIRLHSRRGRMDLWYKENKDGILGLGLTVLISFVTALFTVLVFTR